MPNTTIIIGGVSTPVFMTPLEFFTHNLGITSQDMSKDGVDRLLKVLLATPGVSLEYPGYKTHCVVHYNDLRTSVTNLPPYILQTFLTWMMQGLMIPPVDFLNQISKNKLS